MTFKTLNDLAPEGKRILVRVDINVPLSPEGTPTDITRITRVIPTLKELLARGGKVIVLAHLGRPEGKPMKKYSLKPLVPVLAEALEKPVGFIEDLEGPLALDQVEKMEPGEILLGENVRFYPGEEINDPSFVSQLARLGDAYVNDAFSASHRAHASIYGIARQLPAFAGRLMEEEMTALRSGLTNPRHPLMAIVGGSKVSTKLVLLANLISKVDQLVVGGGMANTFLLAQGVPVGSSLCEPDMVPAAQAIFHKAEQAGVDLILPCDGRVRREDGSWRDWENFQDILPGEAIMDMGPRSQAQVINRLTQCQTVIWNGPVGLFEVAPFHEGTMALAKAIAQRTEEGGLVSVAGGGDTVAALHKAGCLESFTYVSTAGGAFLEWLEGRDLPGVSALSLPPLG
jgi:phosphoglycerate kinase